MTLRVNDSFLLRRGSIIAVISVTALMLSTAILFEYQAGRGAAAKKRIIHTYEITRHVQRLFHRVKDVQLGMSGFLLTGEEKYLRPYRDALKIDPLTVAKADQSPNINSSVADELEILQALTSDNPSQQSQVTALRGAIHDLLDYWNVAFAPQTSGRPKVDFGHADDLLHAVRAIGAAMMEQENALLGERIAAEKEQDLETRWLTRAGILLFYLVALGYIAFHRRTRIKAEVVHNRLLLQLNESNTELEHFAYVASHDMQEPLRMMANFSAFLANEYQGKLDKDGQEYLDIIVGAAKRMQALVADLLEYARVGNDTTQFTTIKVSDEVNRVLENLSTAIGEHKARVTVDKMPEILGNPVQFMRLLQNLVGNALKYQSPGSLPRIHVGAEDDGAVWRFFVRDNGIGIRDEYLGSIFEPFKRLHSWQQYQGSGIGLAVCKKIVENHGGQIWATSGPQNGSTFYFTMPKIRKDAR